MSKRPDLRLVHNALSEAAGREIPEEEFAALATPERAAEYLSQGLPEFRGDLPEYSYQATFHERWPTLVTRYWWPRFVAPIERGHGPARFGFITWTDDPGDQRDAIIAQACERFRVKPPE